MAPAGTEAQPGLKEEVDYLRGLFLDALSAYKSHALRARRGRACLVSVKENLDSLNQKVASGTKETDADSAVLVNAICQTLDDLVAGAAIMV